MAKLLCNSVLNRLILKDSVCLKAVTSKLPAISGHSVEWHHLRSNSNHSDQHSGNRKSDSKYVLWAAAPTFLAFFKKPESEDDESLTWLDKLIPLRIKLMFQKQDDSPEGQLVMTIKRAILCAQEKQHEKAEQLIHLALRMAQQMQHADGITLCFDIMANCALETEQFEKAEKLFVAVMQRLLEKGVKQNDIKVFELIIFLLNEDLVWYLWISQVLHISLKIAQIAEHQSQPDKAELGYQWTLAELEKAVKNDSNDPDLYELWGLAND